jgi:RHS repeat-associated protein
LTYGVDEERRKSVYRIGATTKLTHYYLGDYEEEVFPNGTIRKIHYLSGGAILISTNGQDSLLYGYTDYQGSLIALTDENNVVLQRYAYDPWGNRRNPNNWTQKDTRTAFLLNRGYTGHEHLDVFGVINMNGRVYDPLTAQFLSPDPFVQAPEDWLNYNRYSYCLNNPMLYTDPSGEFIFSLFLPGIGVLLDAACWGAVIGGASYTASVAFSDGGFSNWSWSNFGKAAGMGAISGFATAGLGMAFGPIGSNGVIGELARAAYHGFANGMISTAFGGDFYQGLASGAFGSLAGSAFMMYGGNIASSQLGNYAFSAVAGGVGAELAGGKFWEGFAVGLTTAGLNHIRQGLRKNFTDEQLKKIFEALRGDMNYRGGSLYELIGGELGKEAALDPKGFENNCAVRLSRALNYSGFIVLPILQTTGVRF